MPLSRLGRYLLAHCWGTDQFLQFCSARGLSINRKRIIRLERLGFFAPVFRVRTPKKPTPPFRIPPSENNNWFSRRLAHDTTAVPSSHFIPTDTDRTQEGYYSIFQVAHLAFVLSRMTVRLQVDSYLDLDEGDSIEGKKEEPGYQEYAQVCAPSLRDHESGRAVALLCQHVSNRYFPETQTDMRTHQIRHGHTFDRWIDIDAQDWDWDKEVKNWDPKETERFYRLSPEMLRRVYRDLATDQAHRDPLKNWYELTQFISLHERMQLKGAALLAETIRAGAHLLRLLHKDLYGEELPHPNEAISEVNHFSELDVRHDVRRHLELVANRFGVNPQPKLSLIVEGKSEEVAVTRIFRQYFGAHPGIFGIEIIVLGGVDIVTGGRKDRFRAIMRLIDYLHYHQTYGFLILDNENYARRLEVEAHRMKSIHSKKRYITRPEYIRIWRDSFEFDNFSCTEIASALTDLADGSASFTSAEVANVKRQPNSGSALKCLFRHKTNCQLQKDRLSEILTLAIFSPSSRRKIKNRPIVKTLNRVAKLAALNHFPTTQEAREANQESRFLGLRIRQ